MNSHLTLPRLRLLVLRWTRAGRLALRQRGPTRAVWRRSEARKATRPRVVQSIAADEGRFAANKRTSRYKHAKIRDAVPGRRRQSPLLIALSGMPSAT